VKTEEPGEETIPVPTLSTTNSIWIDPDANPGLRGERPATNDLSHGTAVISGCVGYISYKAKTLARTENTLFTILTVITWHTPIPAVCGRLVAGVAGSNPGRGMDVCLLCLYVVLSCVGRGPCDGLITRPEESYRVSVCV
jgi:hypothetical protein